MSKELEYANGVLACYGNWLPVQSSLGERSAAGKENDARSRSVKVDHSGCGCGCSDGAIKLPSTCVGSRLIP